MKNKKVIIIVIISVVLIIAMLFSAFEVFLHENCTEVRFDKNNPIKLKIIVR